MWTEPQIYYFQLWLHLEGKTLKLKKLHNTADTWVQRHWRQDLYLIKPNITIVKDEHCTIIKVTCSYESSIKYLHQRTHDKVLKYKPLLNELSQVNYYFGSLGTITDSTNKSLRKPKITKQKESPQLPVIKGSCKIMHKHFWFHDFEK